MSQVVLNDIAFLKWRIEIFWWPISFANECHVTICHVVHRRKFICLLECPN